MIATITNLEDKAARDWQTSYSLQVPTRLSHRPPLHIFLSTSLALLALSVVSCSSSQGPLKSGAEPGTDSKKPPIPLTVKEIIAKGKAAVVRVDSSIGVGTGFIVAADGKVATNLHVIAGASAITIELADERKFSVERVIAIDPARDLALLQVAATNLPTVVLGDSDLAVAGDPIVIIGNPLGVLDFTVSDGLVSSVRVTQDVKVIQTSAPISQGSSGGPLFNNFGEVIGIATFFAKEGQNLNFAIPSNYLRPLILAQGGETMSEFSERFRRSAGAAGAIRPTIPIHKVSLLAGCSADQIRQVEEGIHNAIAVGAPVYNRGEREACFVIYRSAAENFEKDNTLCKGIRDAFGQGLLVADSKADFTEKAWAMRDAFDGLLIVFNRKRNQ